MHTLGLNPHSIPTPPSSSHFLSPFIKIDENIPLLDTYFLISKVIQNVYGVKREDETTKQ